MASSDRLDGVTACLTPSDKVDRAVCPDDQLILQRRCWRRAGRGLGISRENREHCHAGNGHDESNCSDKNLHAERVPFKADAVGAASHQARMARFEAPRDTISR